MIIGCPKELKNNEFRVGLTPNNVKEYVLNGHKVYIETSAGVGAGFSDEEYVNAGAIIVNNPKDLYAISEMIVKVKESEESEYKYLKENQIVFTFLHLAANKKLTKVLLDKKITGIAYETIVDEQGKLPCLIPMSEIAGKLSIQEGAKYLEKSYGGRGVLLGGTSTVKNGTVLVLGGGTVGSNAVKVAIGMGAEVIVLDNSIEKLNKLKSIYNVAISTLFLNDENLVNSLKVADLVVCSILIPGATAPKLITREHLKLMKQGAVIVDVSIDQGGCLETSKITTHDNPIFIEESIVHYCVNNMPGAVPHTSTVALTNVTIKYGLEIANNGMKDLTTISESIKAGLNTFNGFIVNENVRKAYGK